MGCFVVKILEDVEQVGFILFKDKTFYNKGGERNGIWNITNFYSNTDAGIELITPSLLKEKGKEWLK